MSNERQAAEAAGGEEEAGRAFAKAVDLLAARPHFRAELNLKLERRGFAETARRETLDRLTEAGYLDDLAAARSFAARGTERKSWGPRRLVAELARRGVPEEHVTTAVAEAFPEGEAAVARAALARWAPRATGGAADRDRLARFLDRRGFSKAVIVEILREFASGAADDS